MLSRNIMVLLIVILRITPSPAQTVLEPLEVVAPGGGTSASAGTGLQASIGQPAIQDMTSSSSDLEPGFLPAEEELLIPATTVSEGWSHGWALISLSVLSPDTDQADLFPGSISKVFGYHGSYTPVLSLQGGIGYWLKFGTDTSLVVSGLPIQQESIAVAAAWNLIGSLSIPVPVSSIGSDSPSVVLSSIFGYTGSYHAVDSIRPGQGYWVKVNKTCHLLLASDSIAGWKNMPKIIPSAERPPEPPAETDKSAVLPAEYVLHHSYPDPCNPSATIRYDLPSASSVSLMVYDILGQVVSVLRDGPEEAGYHAAVWNGSMFATGVYFYRLEARSLADPQTRFGGTGKMILAK